VPRESIGQCGCAQYPDKRWITAELGLAICYIRHACGEPPRGYELEILWHEHDLGLYATVGITWDGPCDAPWDYISRAEDALERFDLAVAWSDLAPDLRQPENDEMEVTTADKEKKNNDPAKCEVQEEILASDDSPVSIELYRRDAMIDIGTREWQVALSIFQEEGWSPIRPIETYLPPLGFVPQDEGKEMQLAGRSLFAKIDAERALSVSVPMDLGLLYCVTEFVGGGTFIVGRQGAFATAQANDFSDSDPT
jgi:hypothetical protein